MVINAEKVYEKKITLNGKIINYNNRYRTQFLTKLKSFNEIVWCCYDFMIVEGKENISKYVSQYEASKIDTIYTIKSKCYRIQNIEMIYTILKERLVNNIDIIEIILREYIKYNPPNNVFINLGFYDELRSNIYSDKIYIKTILNNTENLYCDDYKYHIIEELLLLKVSKKCLNNNTFEITDIFRLNDDSDIEFCLLI